MDLDTLLLLAARMAADGAPVVRAYALRATGTRMRAFDLSGVKVMVDADHDNDALLGESAEALAALPALVVDMAAELAAARRELDRKRIEEPEPPPLRARRWQPQRWSGHRCVATSVSAGCDCPVCNVACEPICGWGYRCPGCGLKGEACGASYGGCRACELPHGHDGDHESPGGFSWPQGVGGMPRQKVSG